MKHIWDVEELATHWSPSWLGRAKRAESPAKESVYFQ